MTAPTATIDELCINTIRTLSIDAVEKANSGHPGLPMGAAPMAYVLWTRHMRYDPAHPDWSNRDRFVLSAGHGSALLYSLLYLTGYPLTLDDLKHFRQWGSKTPGHPERGSHTRCRCHHWAARSGLRQRGGDGDGGAMARGNVQSARVTRSSTTAPTSSRAMAT